MKYKRIVKDYKKWEKSVDAWCIKRRFLHIKRWRMLQRASVLNGKDRKNYGI